MSRRFSSLFRKNNDWVPGVDIEMMTFSTFMAGYGVYRLVGTHPSECLVKRGFACFDRA